VQVADLILMQAPQGLSRSHFTFRTRHSTQERAGLRRRFAGPLPSVSAQRMVGCSTIWEGKEDRSFRRVIRLFGLNCAQTLWYCERCFVRWARSFRSFRLRGSSGNSAIPRGRLLASLQRMRTERSDGEGRISRYRKILMMLRLAGETDSEPRSMVQFWVMFGPRRVPKLLPHIPDRRLLPINTRFPLSMPQCGYQNYLWTRRRGRQVVAS
jgi:hypothetical protein